MQNLAFGDLAIEIADDDAGGAIRLVWSGKSNDRQPGKVLDPFFGAVVRDATQKGVGIEMRFDRLEHFNSATITSLIGLVQQARNKGIKLALVFDKALKWQKLSFDALRVLGKGDGLLEIRSI
jgi:hypothetical protein